MSNKFPTDQAEALYMELGRRVRDYRKAVRGRMSQEELAKACGMNRATIAAIEAGRQSVALHQIFRIAEALDVRPSALIPPDTHAEVKHMLSRISSDADSADLDTLSRIAEEVFGKQEQQAAVKTVLGS